MINPNDITTVRVGQLADSPFNLTDNLVHEVGTDLNRGTVQSFADFLALYIGSSSSVAFRAVTVPDGGTLPVTSQEEWILVGKGTFYNVGGGATIVCAEELNALISNGTFWSIGVEIPISADLIGITQFIRSGYLQTSPSENAVYNALLLKANLTDVPAVLPKMYFVADGINDSFDTGSTAIIKAVYRNNIMIRDPDWSQVGSIFTLTFVPDNGDEIKPI
jgi:hypothetical protein